MISGYRFGNFVATYSDEHHWQILMAMIFVGIRFEEVDSSSVFEINKINDRNH